MGYGFVEFKSAADAQQALRRMHLSRLHDHVLQLKPSERASAAAGGGGDAGNGDKGGRAAEGAGPGKSTATLMVRNMPFEASKEEVRELFGSFGQLKAVRLPKKFQGTHRGFAFVEFVSKGEATKAMTALQSTHLYGRHLVLQYAQAETSVEGLRDKMRAQLVAEASAAAAVPVSRRTKGSGGGDASDPFSITL